MITPAAFEKFKIRGRDLDIWLSNIPLSEKRGVGAVSRSLQEGFSKLREVETVPKTKRVFLFPFFHQWPDPMTLRRAVLIVHDFSVIRMLEFTRISEGYTDRLRKVCRSAPHIVAVSESVKADLIHHCGIDEAKITVIHNPVSLEAPVIPKDIALPTTPYLAFISVGNEYKNLAVIFRALKLISNASYKLVVCGRRSEKEMALCEELGLMDRVVFMGYRTPAEVSAVLSRSNGLLYPSEYEGFGLGPFEAALAGKPSVVHAKPAMNEVIKADEVHWCPDTTPEAWAGAMLKLFLKHGDPDMAERFAKRIRRELSPAVVASKYVALLDSAPI